MDPVFKALADPTRRGLLDRLFERDGQSLGELAEPLGMTRYGVMKHLRVLEEAGLVVARRAGRRKLHFLNPIPIRQLHDRWIDKYREPWARGLVHLKDRLEAPMTELRHVFQIWIRATPERIWQAITDPEVTERYFHRARVESAWSAGDPVTYWLPERRLGVEGEVLEAQPPRRLVTTWAFRYAEDVSGDPPSRVVWEIEPEGDVCRLTVTHEGFGSETKTFRDVAGGWPRILSSMKSLLETGEPLPIAS